MALTDRFVAIGEAIREKRGSTNTYTLAQMPDEIRAIETGDFNSNFTIGIAQTAPTEAAADNTITIVSDCFMDSYIFSATEPENPVMGLVWIQVGDGALVSFSPVKEQLIMVYPVKVFQYVYQEWLEREAFICGNSKWTQFSFLTPEITDIFLLNGANQCTELSGGWKSSPYSAGSGYATITQSFTVGADGLDVTLDATNGYCSTYISTTNMIDVSQYKTLIFEFSEAETIGDSNGAAQVRLFKDNGYTSIKNVDVVAVGGAVTKTVEIDCSTITDKCYVGVFLWKWQSACKVHVKIASVRLVPKEEE